MRQLLDFDSPASAGNTLFIRGVVRRILSSNMAILYPLCYDLFPTEADAQLAISALAQEISTLAAFDQRSLSDRYLKPANRTVVGRIETLLFHHRELSRRYPLAASYPSA